jgi:hypothetical protein
MALSGHKETRHYVVEQRAYDASRPYAVVATFRSFNQVIARYAERANAQRRARDMNRRRDA